MKKKRLIILLPALVIIFAICWLGYLYFASMAVKEAFYGSIDKNSVKRLGVLPKQIELEINPEPGYTVHFQDYSVTLSGYNDAVIDKDFNDDFISSYHVSSNKLISFKNMDPLRSDFLFDDPVISSHIEKAAGRKLNNEYDFIAASFFCTPKDFTLFDVNKNKGVGTLLLEKSCNASDDCYQFDNGVVKGFISAFNSEGGLATFSNCEVSDSYYRIIFVNFSNEEIKEMLSTIKFDGSDTN